MGKDGRIWIVENGADFTRAVYHTSHRYELIEGLDFEYVQLLFIFVSISYMLGGRFLYAPLSARSRSYRSIAPSRVCAPFPQSSGLQYSAGL
jgi:hypothetical protein